MKMIKTLLVSCALSSFAWQAYAQTPVNVFTGSSLPTEQGWTEQKLDATVNSVAAPTTQAVANGVLKFTSTNAADQFSQLTWYKTGLDFNLATGFVIELKAKVTSADKTGAFNIQGYDRSGKGFRIGVLSNAITEQTDPFAATNVLAKDLTNGDDFHIYRFAVTPFGKVEVARDGVAMGSFPLSFFQFDNIIENGGFEDEEFPDFLSNGTLRRVNDSKKKRFGDYGLEMDNNGKVTNDWTDIEGARTREIAVKPNTDYEIHITRRRTANEPWAWRDMGAFYDTQNGVYNGVDNRDPNVMWTGIDRIWQTHPQTIKTPGDAKTIRFEFPSWIRDDNKYQNTTSFDNFTFREKSSLQVGPAAKEPAHGFPATVFPENYVNLIKNGDFEDHTINNDGTSYEWELASNGGDNDNTPVKYNPLWNGDVRIQDKNKPDDFESGQEYYAHSGTSTLRFSTLGNNSNNFDYTMELEADKTYRFNFWHRAPKWPDWGWLKLKIGDNLIWGHELKGDWGGLANNVWTNADIVFTTTAENKTLHLYTDSDSHGDWWNLYLDDLVLYEVSDDMPLDPQIEGKTNLIANGDFEDITIDNNGQPYTWALATGSAGNDDNYPVAWSDVWGTYVRLQDKQKVHDTGNQWAHSGNKALRVSYLDDWGKAQEFEGVNGDVLPDAYKTNINFEKELEPNKTYTFVFWIKTANYNDRGRLVIGNDDIRLWDEELSTKYINWTRQSITFSTTGANHVLRMYTEFGGWFNFYLDDLFLFEEDTYVPASEDGGTTYLAFGKSTGTSSADVEIEYITIEDLSYKIAYNLDGGQGSIDGTYTVKEGLVALPTPSKDNYDFVGWYANSEYEGEAVTEIPAGSIGDKEFWAKWKIATGISDISVSNITLYPNPVVNGELTIENIQSIEGRIEIYNLVGILVNVYDITGATTKIDVSTLSTGTYIVKVDGATAIMLKK